MPGISGGRDWWQEVVTMGQAPDRRQFRTTVIASVVSIVFSSTLALLPQVRDPKNTKYAVPALYVLIVVLLAWVIGYNLLAYLRHVKQIRDETRALELVNSAVPRLVTFKKRQDTYVIEANGNGTLTWEFDLASHPQDYIPTLTFPVYAEVSGISPPPTSVIVDLIEVNGQRRNTNDAYELIEHRIPQDRGPEAKERIDFGLLRVPVNLVGGRDSCHVRVQMRLFQVFRRVFQYDPVFIDIPYLTEGLTVKITSNDYNVVSPPRPPNGSTVMAMSGIMHTEDKAETSFQNDKCFQRDGALLWHSESLKLAYRYKLWFRLEES
jgi:hypothetical protein